MRSQTKKLFSCLLLIGLLPACGGVPGKASPNDPSGNFSQVSADIYRGGRPDEAGVQTLAQMGVKTIVDLENDPTAIANEKTWADAAGIQFISEQMNGMATPNDQQVDRVLAAINDPANRPVFVHCMQGHDRTGLIIALYRVLFEGWTPKDAHDEMMALGYNSLLMAMNHYFEQKTHWDD